MEKVWIKKFVNLCQMSSRMYVSFWDAAHAVQYIKAHKWILTHYYISWISLRRV